MNYENENKNENKNKNKNENKNENKSISAASMSKKSVTNHVCTRYGVGMELVQSGGVGG